MTTLIFALLIIFQLKHFLADYPLQGAYMLRKFLPDWGFVLPLLAHVSVHGLMTAAIVYTVEPNLWWLGLVDAAVHFAMDRIKASPYLLGRYKALSAREYKGLEDFRLQASANASPERLQSVKKVYGREIRNNTLFWWSLGLDQMVHHLTDIFTIYMLVRQG